MLFWKCVGARVSFRDNNFWIPPCLPPVLFRLPSSMRFQPGSQDSRMDHEWGSLNCRINSAMLVSLCPSLPLLKEIRSWIRPGKPSHSYQFPQAISTTLFQLWELTCLHQRVSGAENKILWKIIDHVYESRHHRVNFTILVLSIVNSEFCSIIVLMRKLNRYEYFEGNLEK